MNDERCEGDAHRIRFSPRWFSKYIVDYSHTLFDIHAHIKHLLGSAHTCTNFYFACVPCSFARCLYVLPACLLFVFESIDVNVWKKCSKCKWNIWFQINVSNRLNTFYGNIFFGWCHTPPATDCNSIPHRWWRVYSQWYHFYNYEHDSF